MQDVGGCRAALLAFRGEGQLVGAPVGRVAAAGDQSGVFQVPEQGGGGGPVQPEDRAERALHGHVAALEQR